MSSSGQQQQQHPADADNHSVYLVFHIDKAKAIDDKLTQAVESKTGQDSFISDALAWTAKMAFGVVSTAKETVAGPDMSLGPKLGNNIVQAAAKKNVEVRLFELLQVHKDGKVIIVYNMKVCQLDLDKILDQKAAERGRRIPGFIKKIVLRRAKRKDINAKAAEGIYKNLPERVSNVMGEKGVSGGATAHRQIAQVKDILLKEHGVAESKIVFANPGKCYELEEEFQDCEEEDKENAGGN